MPEEERISIPDIIRELDDLKNVGYGAIQITAPYRSAGAYPWWGLRPLDYFRPNQTLGEDMDSFRTLVRECHRREIHVLIFLNLGYADIGSCLWETACADKKRGLPSPHSPAGFFLWSDVPQAPFPSPREAPFLSEGSWVYSREADAWYWSHWKYTSEDGRECAEPQYDWQSPAWQEYAGKVLNFWLGTGADGIILDAVNWYLNCDFSVIKRFVTDVIHKYPDVCCIPEGAGGFGDDTLSWLERGGFDLLEDQTFHSDLSWNGSAIMDAVRSGTAKGLSLRLRQADRIRAAGGCSWAYLSYDFIRDGEVLPSWTPSLRLLEIAVLVGTGHMTDIITPYLSAFSPAETDQLGLLIRAGRHPGLSLYETARYLEYGLTELFFCLRSERCFPVLCIYQFSDRAGQLACADLVRMLEPYCRFPRAASVSFSSLTGEGKSAGGDGAFRIGPYGYLFLEVKAG